MATAVIARQLTLSTSLPVSFLGLRLPEWTLLPTSFLDIAQLIFYISSFLLLCAFSYNAFFEGKILPPPVILMLLTVAAAFGLRSDLEGLFWFYLPAFYHGSQYLAITLSQYLKEKNYDIRNGGMEMSNEAMSYYLSLLLIAVAIYIGLPQALRLAGVQYNLAFATVFVLLGLHHFLTDQAIWKLRDSKVRNSLV